MLPYESRNSTFFYYYDLFWFLVGPCNLLLLNGKYIVLPKIRFRLGIIGLMEIIPAFSMALFAGHIVDQKEKRNLLAMCIAAFSLISFGLVFTNLAKNCFRLVNKTILYAIYALVFFGGFLRSFFGPTIFSLNSTNCT